MKDRIKSELKRLFKSMDFISNRYLKSPDADTKEAEIFFEIYQQLGIAWEFLGLQCEHWDGYKMTREKKETCRICGKVKGVDDFYYLLPKKGRKTIGRKLQPNSKNTLKNKRIAEIVNDSIEFHGASVKVNVHNSYKSRLLGDKHEINIAADRRVTVKERGIQCNVDKYLVHITTSATKQKGAGKKYGGFPWELKKETLKKFPVIFDFDEDDQFLGLTILR